MELTQVEKALIEALRNGNSVEVWVHEYTNDFDKAVEAINAFGDVTRIVDMKEKIDSITIKYKVGKLSVNAFVDA